MRSLKIALPLIAAILAVGAAQADPVKIRLSYVIAPSDWAPLLPEKPDLLKHNGKSYQLEVVRVCPRALHLAGGCVGVADAAHALDDALGEANPDLLVVVELGVALQVD